MPASYDASKSWRGRSYTGMKVGRSHHWDYEGRWVERKVSPDLWEFSFTATKTRKGKGAPEGSGAPVGTEYFWFFAPTAQITRKMDANRYDTHLEGLKWKIGFRPATSKTWDFAWERTGETARQRSIRILTQALADLKAQEKAGEPDLVPPDLASERPAPPKKAKATTKATKRRKAARRKAATRTTSREAPAEA